MQQVMEDQDIMPFGKHKGRKLIEVPDSYLMWFWRTNHDLYVSGSPTLHYNGRKLMKYIHVSFNEKDLLNALQTKK